MNAASATADGWIRPRMPIPEIARLSLAHMDRVLSHYLSDGKRHGREYLARNPLRQDAKPGSFSLNLDTGRWADFATGDKGGDLVSLVAYLSGAKQGEAADELAELLGIGGAGTAPAAKVNGRHLAGGENPSKPVIQNAAAEVASATIVMPVPDDAPAAPASLGKIGKYALRWDYRDASGRLLLYVCRWNTHDGKDIRPLTLWRESGRLAWRWKACPTPRPLYGLDRLTARPDASVIVCEGEKAADAAERILPAFVAVTSLNGAQAPDKSDWSPLTGRRVVIWPDADQAGTKYANAVTTLARAAGAASVAVLDIAQVRGERSELPAGYDAADFEADGRDAVTLAANLTIPTPVPAAPDWHATVERLAKLPALEYERVRKAEAAALGIERVSILDAEVRRARGDSDDTAAGSALTFPDIEPWPDPVSGSAVLNDIAKLCGRFLQLPKHADTVVAAWVALTYAADAFDCLPMLFITAPEKGCGKSTVLDLVERLSLNTLSASNISPAALFRVVELVKPTLLLDEADSFLRDNEEMRGILNSGHTRASAWVIRTVGDNHEPRRFSTRCPKVLAGIGRLPATIEDRSHIITMQRLAPGERVDKLRRDHQFVDLRRKLRRWADDHGAELALLRVALPEHLRNRTADNWECLFAIARIAGGDWWQRIERAASSFTGEGHTAESVGTELLRDIRAAFQLDGTERLRSARLIELITADESNRWADYDHGRPITAPQVAKLLKRYGIKPKVIRNDSGTPRGYEWGQFADVFSRYLPCA